jgi:hypothetical protein
MQRQLACRVGRCGVDGDGQCLECGRFPPDRSQHGSIISGGTEGIPRGRRSVTLCCFLNLVRDAQAARLGAGAGPRNEAAERQDGLGWVAEPFGDHGCPKGQNQHAVVASWERLKPPVYPCTNAVQKAALELDRHRPVPKNPPLACISQAATTPKFATEPMRAALERLLSHAKPEVAADRAAVALRANDDETPDRREFRLEGAEGSPRTCPCSSHQSMPRRAPPRTEAVGDIGLDDPNRLSTPLSL